jgi:F0F1-type ATP synthase epsilon subunit
MSYCTARRQAAQQRVRELEERLKHQEERDHPARERLREELARAVAELVTIGDCGD